MTSSLTRIVTDLVHEGRPDTADVGKFMACVNKSRRMSLKLRFQGGQLFLGYRYVNHRQVRYVSDVALPRQQQINGRQKENLASVVGF